MLLICFLTTIISFINSCCNFNLDFLCLVGVASGTGFVVGSGGTFGSVAGSGCHVGILSKFFIGNTLLLELSRIFSLPQNNDSKLFK